jgi:hypothetical protein
MQASKGRDVGALAMIIGRFGPNLNEIVPRVLPTPRDVTRSPVD